MSELVVAGRLAHGSVLKRAPYVHLLWFTVLCALCVLVYAQTLEFEFINLDDKLLVRGNPHLADGINAEFIHWSITTILGGNWNPLVWWSFALDNSLLGAGPRGHHLTNLILHGLNTIVLYLLFVRLRLSTAQAALGAAIFAVHPQHVEAVAWIMARKDLLSTLFGLLAILTYLNEKAERGGLAQQSKVALLMLLSIMAKPMFITLPAILLLLDFWPLRRFTNLALKQNIISLIQEKWLLLLLSTAAGLVGYLSHAIGGGVSSPVWEIVAGNVLKAYALYLSKFFLPLSLSPYYPYSNAGIDLVALLALMAMLGVSGLCLYFRHRAAWLLIGWLWFLGTLVPVSGVIPFGIQGAADRFSYVPHTGLILIVVAGGARLPVRNAIKYILAVSTLACFAAVAWVQTSHWTNTMTLFQHADSVVENDAFISHQISTEYAIRGEWEKAIQQNLRGIDALDQGAPEIDGLRLEMWRKTGLYLHIMGRQNEALYYLETALENAPHDVRTQQLLDALHSDTQ